MFRLPFRRKHKTTNALALDEIGSASEEVSKAAYQILLEMGHGYLLPDGWDIVIPEEVQDGSGS